MNSSDPSAELALQAANRRLADLLRTAPLPLAAGGAKALEDALWVWGVVGGKNVGKSTLINALAGADVVERGDDLGEGTLEPAAYLTAGDRSALAARLGDLPLTVRYHDGAPAEMRGLVLVDLPDFDSLFVDHAEKVHAIASVLDGVIWVTTPKKVGDLRAIREIRAVLKARTNFAYVVNKMDWLLAQSDRAPQDELARAAAALHAQIVEDESADAPQRCFFIAARYPTAEAVLAAIAASRQLPSSAPVNGALAAAAEKLCGDFARLRAVLTTPPTIEAADANKRANLNYQVRVQAARLLKDYQPREVLARLDRALAPDALEELTEGYFPPAYGAALANRLHRDRALFAEWSLALFKARVVHWPLLGLIAWPLALAGAVLGGIRNLLPSGAAAGDDDPFRCDGVALAQRIEGLRAGVLARLAGLADRLGLELAGAATLEAEFRQDVLAATSAQRTAALDALCAYQPSVLGRGLRWFVPVATVLWFPLVQPVLEVGLAALSRGGVWDMTLLRGVVEALSAGKVLTGLCVAALVLAGLTAAVYGRAVRDTFVALDRLRGDVEAEAVSSPARGAVEAIIAPLRPFRQQLQEVTDRLVALAGEVQKAAF